MPHNPREFQRWLRPDQVPFVPRAMAGGVVRVRGGDGHGSVSPVQVGRLSIDHDDLGRLTDQASYRHTGHQNQLSPVLPLCSDNQLLPP